MIHDTAAKPIELTHHTDRFLIGIVVAIILLVVVAFAVILTRPKPSYVLDDTPEGVIQNYLLALQQRDYERAFSYLSPILKNRPTSTDDFTQQVLENQWNFRFDNSSTRGIDNSTVIGDRVLVTVRERQSGGGGPFTVGREYSNTYEFWLARQADAWKITHGDRYWRSCWESGSTCY